MNSNKIKGNIFLLMTAMIWGFAFVAQRTVMVYMPPFLYSGIRMYVGTVSLIVIIIIANKVSIAKELAVEKKLEENRQRNCYIVVWLVVLQCFLLPICNR